jgi:large subunit ribosomal protein L22
MQQSTATASVNHVRIAPRKVRLVIDLIRGKEVGEAIAILRHTPRAASPIIEKILNSAIANAEHNYQLNPNNLKIESAFVNEGPIMKRFRPRAMGRASRINKRTSHITLVVSEK